MCILLAFHMLLSGESKRLQRESILMKRGDDAVAEKTRGKISIRI